MVRPGKKTKASAVAKGYDLWDDEGAAIERTPQDNTAIPGWKLPSENFKQPKEAARRRPMETFGAKPNKRAAVPVPVGGQAYNPADEDHQEALKKTAKALQRKKSEHLKFARKLGALASGFNAGKKGSQYKGNLGGDRLQDDDDALMKARERTERKEKRAQEKAAQKAEKAKLKASETGASGKKKKEKKKKKLNKIELRQQERKARVHRRHPERILDEEIEDIDDIAEEVNEAAEMTEIRRAARKVERREGQTIEHFGRHFVHRLAPDVLPTDQLVGSLRHVNAQHATHPAMDRLKSLEERNLIPARCDHVYDKRKVLKARGEVMIKREAMGIMPLV